jgi:hypothetical protein
MHVGRSGELRGNGKRIATASIAAVAGAVLAAGATAHAAVPRQVGSLKYTSTVPGSSTGLALDFKFQNPDGPGLKPHTVKTLVVHAPPGGVLDTTVPPQCHASDAELMALGPSACPPATKVGQAYAISDTGSSGPFPRYSRTNITEFNNQDEVVAVGVTEDIPALKPVDRTKIEGDHTTTNFPLLPGGPPPDPYSAFKELHFSFSPYARNGKAYNRTPSTCPSVGYWRMVLEFTYVDGVTERVNSDSPCKRPKRPATKHRKRKKHQHRRHRERED